ncbi:hypothetical protein GF412_02215 [Candidatus Micrarchaeota archaeon]|nr:hypothetical protein [Candidatus Micrarchaeota archaeon]MBD3417776.1 hypothetical protein [Candidatus Micrarchaeota archaeon]
MTTKEEIDEVISWCEEVKKEKGVMYTVERNPFRDRVDWMARFPLIEIDRPKETAGKQNLVYDGTTRSLWQYMNNTWMEIIPDVGPRTGKEEG